MFSHFLCVYPFYLNGTVVLIYLDAQLSAGGEVLWLRKVTLEAVVLHGVHVVFHPDQPPLVLGVLVLVARPDLLEVGHNIVSTVIVNVKYCF